MLLKVTFFISANAHFRHRDNTPEKFWLATTNFCQYVLAAGIKEAPFPSKAPLHASSLPVDEWSVPTRPEEPLHYTRELKYPSHSSQIYQELFLKLFTTSVDAYKSHQENVALHTSKASVRRSSLRKCFRFFLLMLFSAVWRHIQAVAC